MTKWFPDPHNEIRNLLREQRKIAEIAARMIEEKGFTVSILTRGVPKEGVEIRIGW